MARQDFLKYRQSMTSIQQKLININMGGSTSQPVTNTYAIKVESQGLQQSNVTTLEKQFKGTYKSFINRLLIKSQIQDLPAIANKQTMYIGSTSYLNKYTNKKALKKQLENFVLSSLKNYVNYSFCIALSRMVEIEINRELKSNPRQLRMGENRSFLVLGDSGSLCKTNFQVGYGYIDKDGSDSDTFFGIYSGISVVNIEPYQLEDFLSPFNLEIDKKLKDLVSVVYNPESSNDDKKEIIEGGQTRKKKKKPSKFKKYAKKTLNFMAGLAKGLGAMKGIFNDNDDDEEEQKKGDDQQEEQAQQGGQMSVPNGQFWIQERPNSSVTPYWRVGLITAIFQIQNKPDESFSFTGTIIDEYAILTSGTVLLNGHSKTKGQLKRITIKLEDQRKSRVIKKDMIDFGNIAENSHYFLFLERPCWSSLPEHTQFITSFVQEPSVLYGIQNSKIYTCGYSRSGKDAKLEHQSSRVFDLYQTHFIDGFRKSQCFIGAPIYLFDAEQNIFNIFGVNHSKLQKITDIFKEQKQKNDNLTMSSYASEFIQKEWFYIRTKYDLIKATFKLKSAKTKEEIYKGHQQPAQSLQYQIQKRRIRAVSCIHSIGVIEMSNHFGTSYGLGVQILSSTGSSKQKSTKQLDLLTLSKYVEDNTKVMRVFVKKFVETEEDPLEFELRRINKYNVYFVNQINKINGQEQLSLLRLSNKPTEEVWIRAIKQENLEDLYPLMGFIVSINRQASNDSTVKLKITGLEEHDVLELHKKNNQKSNPFVEGLLFASQRSPLQWVKYYEFFYGFYQEVKTGKGGSGQISYMSKGKEIAQSVAIYDQRRIISNTDKAPYKSIGIIMSKFNVPETVIRVGTCSLLKSEDPSRTFLITCAHNVVYRSSKETFNWEKQFDQNVKIFLGKQSQIPWVYSELEKKFSGQNQIIKNIWVHPNYLSHLGKNSEDNQLKPQNFFDIAVIQIEKPKDMADGGFIIKLNKPDQNKLFIKNIQVSGYPAKEDKYKSKFGVLYTEAVNFHEAKYQQMCYQVIKQKQETIIKHKLSTLSGNSGSPIFYPINQKQYGLLGIHIAGVYRTNQTFNLGSFIYNTSIFKWLSDIPGLLQR